MCLSSNLLPRPFPLADLLRRRLAPPYPCSLGAILTILTCLLAQGWPSTTIMSIPNEQSCCWAPQGQPPPDFRRPVLCEAPRRRLVLARWRAARDESFASVDDPGDFRHLHSMNVIIV